MTDVLAVLFYAFATDDMGPNSNGVDYDANKGVDADGDSTNDNPGGATHDLTYGDCEGDGLAYDRSAATQDPVTGKWATGAPNCKVDMVDVLAALAQFGINCG